MQLELRPPPVGPARRPRGRWWHGTALILVVSVPCLVVEEGWHHRALFDWSHAWVPFAVAVSLAFLLGGGIAGASAPGGRRGALGRGLAAGLAAIACLVVADLVRRDVIVRETLSLGVVKLWLAAGAGAVVLAGLGGLGGWAVGSRRRGGGGARGRRGWTTPARGVRALG